ncbi:MAG TPA: substrate-binding domain-containing protein, partial [Pseudolabrys sp.]
MTAMSAIKVLSTHAVVEVLAELVPAFERASGHTLSFSYNPTTAIRREIDGGAAFDVAIITRAAVDELAAQ